jgi:hypothetical protein
VLSNLVVLIGTGIPLLCTPVAAGILSPAPVYQTQPITDPGITTVSSVDLLDIDPTIKYSTPHYSYLLLKSQSGRPEYFFEPD